MILAAAEVSARRADLVEANDPHGFIVTLICVCVVFCALVVLFLLFNLLGKYMVYLAHRKEAKTKGVPTSQVKGTSTASNSEVIAAIAAAIHLYKDELHDTESDVITINRVARAYSPWSSKIHGLTQLPTRK